MTGPGTLDLRRRGPSWAARRPVLLVVALALGAALVRVPFLLAPLGPDEGGFLLVASQWGPGRSLYGEYWVDRPPLLLAVFAAADHLGGAPALRAFGAVAVLVGVFAAAGVGALVASPEQPGTRSRAAVMVAATAAVFLTTPVFGAGEVDGELLAVPCVLVGTALLLLAVRTPHPERRRAWLLFGAGCVGAAAVLLKQTEIDVVVVLVVLVWLRSPGVSSTRLGARDAAAVGAGAAVVTAAALLAAAARGTTPLSLWDAIVVFRLQAAHVVGASASPATSHRALLLLGALLLSGAPVLVLAALHRARAPWPAGALDVRPVAAAVLAWEAVVVVGGGSYWLHYLLVLVPGLVLCVGVLQAGAPGDGSSTGRAVGRSPVPPVLVWAAAVCLVGLGWTATHPDEVADHAPVVAWLTDHVQPGEDAVVAYGQPEILQAAGLTSPYPDIWSLPVRVHDPRLQLFAALLRSDRAPDWVVLTQPDLRTWGIDATNGQAALSDGYRFVARVGTDTVYRRAL